MSRRTLPDVRVGSGSLSKVRHGLGDPPEGRGWVFGLLERFEMGRETLPEVRDGSGDHA